jgi:hypothetical protein
MSSQARASHQLFKIIAPQNNESSTPQFHKLSKGVSKMVVKPPHEIIFRTRKCGTPLFAFPSFAEGLLLIPVDLIPCRQARRPFNNQLFSDQMSSRSRSFLEQSRFSKSPCREVIHHLSVLITSNPSELSQEVNSGSIKAFANLLFVAIMS